MKVIRIHVPGGLGNQFFAYFAGLRFAMETNAKIAIALDSYDRSHTNGRYDITSFELLSIKTDNRGSSSIRKFLKRFVNGIRRRNKLFYKISDYVTGNVNQGEQSFQNSDINDFQNRINKVLSRKFYCNVNLYGYFHNYEFIQGLPVNMRQLKLVNPSTWFYDLDQEAKIKSPIMIHIRAGDAFFKSHFENVGVLHPEYFRTALNRVLTYFPDKEIWVFSNDIEKVKTIYSNIYSQLNFVDANMDSDPAETLLLLTRACALIASNSTFSLISSVINPDSRLVVVPSNFMRNGEPQPNYLNNWIIIKSRWLESEDLSKSNL